MELKQNCPYTKTKKVHTHKNKTQKQNIGVIVVSCLACEQTNKPRNKNQITKQTFS